jgi:MFS family permease
MTEGPTIRPPAQRAVAFGALRHRNFRLFFAGMVVSLIGMWMHRVAQSWLVLELTDSPFYVGLVDSLSYLPVLLFSLYAGALADRVSKRRVVMATQTGAMVLAFALAAFVFTDAVTIWHIMVVAGGIGIALAFDIPARQAFIVEMVGKEDLTNAIALNSSAFNGTRVIGPAIAGALIAAVGIGACFLVNGVTYIPMIAALALIRLPEHRPSAERKSTWSTIREGFRYVMSDRRIRVVMVNIAMLSVFGLPVLVLLPVVIRDELGLGAVEFGWTMSYSSLAFGVLVILFALSRSYAVTLSLLVLIGLSFVTTTALSNTLLQTIAPDELRGRVISFYAFAFVGFAPFGALVAGAIAERFGTTPALVLGGSVSMVAVLLGVMRSQGLRETR